MEIVKGVCVDWGFLLFFFVIIESWVVVFEELWVLLCDVMISLIV